ncbi:hypothetical protein BD413DRAFT_468939 [Trametes elegans]|nr:hypothetical protein BD413DRAFT_468939 [Trametes elegans]
MSLSLTPAISGVLQDLPALIERTLKHETACHSLVAQCGALAAQIEAAKARVANEKAARRVLRTEIAVFLRERGELRSASACFPSPLFLSLSLSTACAQTLTPSLLRNACILVAAAIDSSRVLEDSSVVSNTSDRWKKSVALLPDEEPDQSVDFQESPLSLKSKRKGRLFSVQVHIPHKRRRLTVSSPGMSKSAA